LALYNYTVNSVGSLLLNVNKKGITLYILSTLQGVVYFYSIKKFKQKIFN